MDYSALESLSTQDLFYVAEQLSLNEINNFCVSSAILKQRICDQPTFWQNKFRKDFPTSRLLLMTEDLRSWQEKYYQVYSAKLQFNIVDGIVNYQPFISPNRDMIFQRIESVISHALVLTYQGRVISFGTDDGLGKLGAQLEPLLATGTGYVNGPEQNIVEISVGAYHNLLLDDKGQVWHFGDNRFGQGGFSPEHQYVFIPHKIQGLPQIVQVAAGTPYSLFLDSTGQVWGCGNSSEGSLGYYSNVVRSKPFPIPRLSSVKLMSATFGYSLHLTSSGKLWQLGHGELLQDEQPPVYTPIPVNFNITKISAGFDNYLLDDQGQVWEFSSDRGLPEEFRRPHLIGLSGVVDISRGSQTTYFYKRNGEIWSLAMGPDQVPRLLDSQEGILDIAGIFGYDLVIKT